jgi:hypothetical protein
MIRLLRRSGKASLLVIVMLMSGIGLMLMLIALGTAAPAAADNQATITFSAPDGEIPIDTEITVTVHLSDVVDLYALALIVHYPPDLLQVVDSSSYKTGIQAMPADCPNPILPLGIVVENLADNQAGDLSYAITQLAPTPPVSGDCDVLHIRFRAIDGPTANLEFSLVTLADRDGTELPVTIVNRQLTLEKAGTDLYLPAIIKTQ